MSALDELIELAESTPGPVQYWDPLKLSEKEFWGQSNDATIGFLRHAEIKHGRVAMAGFVGYCLHANGFQFPLHIPGDYTTKSPAELWDQVPTNGKLQIPSSSRSSSSSASSAAASARRRTTCAAASRARTRRSRSTSTASSRTRCRSTSTTPSESSRTRRPRRRRAAASSRSA